MTTIELKNLLISKITEIEDKSFLITINSIIEANSGTQTYKTNPLQRKKIQEGREQIEKGDFFTDESVKKEADRWLNER